MNGRVRLFVVTVTCAVLLVISVNGRLLADEGGHDEKIKIPETVAQIWHEIDEQVDLLGSTIAGGKLDQVHEVAFAIRDLAKSLPAKSKDLSEAKLKMVKGYIKRIAEHAENLDTYGDQGDKDKTKAEFAQLKKRLDYMRKLYPGSVSESKHSRN